jgi:hypothetical protein
VASWALLAVCLPRNYFWHTSHLSMFTLLFVFPGAIFDTPLNVYATCSPKSYFWYASQCLRYFLLSQQLFLTHLSMFTLLFAFPGTIFDTPLNVYGTFCSPRSYFWYTSQYLRYLLLSQEPFLIHLSMFTLLFALPGTIFDTPLNVYATFCFLRNYFWHTSQCLRYFLLSQELFFIHLSMFTLLFAFPETIFDTPLNVYATFCIPRDYFWYTSKCLRFSMFKLLFAFTEAIFNTPLTVYATFCPPRKHF